MLQADGIGLVKERNSPATCQQPCGLVPYGCEMRRLMWMYRGVLSHKTHMRIVSPLNRCLLGVSLSVLPLDPFMVYEPEAYAFWMGSSNNHDADSLVTRLVRAEAFLYISIAR